MIKHCKAKTPSSCSYHGRTLVSKNYVELVNQAKLVSSESLAMQTIVDATNMNPDVLLKEVRLKEQNILARIDSTPEGLIRLEQLMAAHEDNDEMIQRLVTRKHVAIMLSIKRNKLSEEIEEHKRSWIPQIKGRAARVSMLSMFVQSKIDSLKGATARFAEMDEGMEHVTVSSLALIEELEEVKNNLTIELV